MGNPGGRGHRRSLPRPNRPRHLYLCIAYRQQKARRPRTGHPISRRSKELPQGLLVPLLCEAPVVPEFVLVPPVVPVVPLVEPAPVVPLELAPEEVDDPLPLGCEPPLFMPAPPCEEPAVLERPEDEEVSELLPVPPEPMPLSFDPLHPARKPAVITAKTSCFIILPYSPSPSLTASGDRINGEPT